MRKNDAEYWRERERQREKERNANGTRLTLKLFEEYSKSAKRIKNEIAAFYGKYAGKYGLTYEKAVKLLNRYELQEWKGELSEYVERIKLETDEEVKKKLTAQLDALSANSRITRLSALLGQIDWELNELYAKAVDDLKSEFSVSFEEEYYKRSYDIQCRAGYFNELAKIDVGSVKRAVSYPWSGADFSDRLWRSKETLIFNMREVLTQGLIQGKSVATMSKELSDRLGQSYKNSERLIRTENAYITGQADIEAYNAAGVEWYEFMATEDDRTSEICRSLDGKKFRISEAKAGVNYPPMHPNCRSTTIECIPDEENTMSSEAVPDVTYEKWLEKYVKQALTDADDDGRIKEDPVLSDEEVYALDLYKKSNISYKLNGCLRNGVGLDEEQKKIKEAVDRVLKKLPKYAGIVYRSLDGFMIDDVEVFGERYREGNIVKEEAYTSTSTGVHDKRMAIQMIIQSKNGRDMRKYNRLENEILFERNTIFKIIKKEGNIIWMEEI